MILLWLPQSCNVQCQPRPSLLVTPGRHACRLARGLHEPNLDTWRPRVNGVQLKALQASASAFCGVCTLRTTVCGPVAKPACQLCDAVHMLRVSCLQHAWLYA